MLSHASYDAPGRERNLRINPIPPRAQSGGWEAGPAALGGLPNLAAVMARSICRRHWLSAAPAS